MGIPRILLAAGASGSGKTMITCGILQALCDRGMKVASFKCGPDYIDPMFHSRVIGTKSRNLDTFFSDENTARYLFLKEARKADISVIEGVMGYYDGLGGISVKASAYDAARVTDTPVILIVNVRGMSVSALAQIKGFLEFRQDSRIKGVIFNQISSMLYPRMKNMVEEQLGIAVYGYVPVVKELNLESRHLGLILPHEISDLRKKLKKLAGILEETLDLEALIRLAEEAGPLYAEDPVPREYLAGENETLCQEFSESQGQKEVLSETLLMPTIAVAKDEVFCFLYEDNLELLQRMGAKLCFFSPLKDQTLPECQGLLLCGGYPELYGKALSENQSMRESIRTALQQGLPCMAECGGFLYLQESLEDLEGRSYPMVGAIQGHGYSTKKLGRFGYITLEPLKNQMLGQDVGPIRGHEFHYYESTCCGSSFYAAKPESSRGWDCIQGKETLVAGFPHLYYYSNPKAAWRFVEKCREYMRKKADETGDF